MPQTIFDASFAEKYWYVSQTYYPQDAAIPTADLNEIRNTYSGLTLGPTVPMVIYEQRGSTSSKFHQYPSDHCAQPRFKQRWECYVFVGCEGQENSEKTRRVGREIKDALLRSGNFKAGGRVHFTTDEPSRIEYYYGSNSDRIKKIVATYDPHQLFASCNGMSF